MTTHNGYDIGPGADLSGADLSEADLRRADLRKANLREADLRGADLREANLREANLCEANLSVADLSGANLCEAYLREANLGGADLREANLHGANLHNCVGNGKQVLGLACLPLWTVVYTSNILQIGCENHPIEDWWTFSDAAIDAMDSGTLLWWREHKDWLRATIERYPATPTHIKELQS